MYRISRISARARPAVPATVVLAALLVVSGCSDGGAPPGSPPEEGSATSSEAPSTPPVTELPDGELGEGVAWVLDAVDEDGEVDPQQVRQRFSAEFVAQLPPRQVVATFAQVRELAPFEVVEVAPVVEQGAGQAVALRLRGSEPVVMELSVDGDGRISGLRFRPDPEAEPPASYDSLDEMSADLAELGTVQAYAGRIEAGGCTTTYEDPGSSEPAPSGSVFKLVVLSAVVSAVADDVLAWTDELKVTAALKSLPSGQLQDRPDGTRVTVREAARLMIAVSDNTAADLLMDAVGPERLASVVRELRLSDPSFRPMLDTRQFFLLGWGERAEDWASAGPERRARILRELPGDLSGVDPASVTTPVWQDGIDWFLTGEEVCRVYARLAEQSTTSAGAPVAGILDPGRRLPGAEDVPLAYKGGSAPGVVALTYMVGRPGEDPEVLVVQVRSENAVDESAAAAAAEAGAAVLARGRP